MPRVPLNEAFPNGPQLSEVAPTHYPTEVTKLDNGLRIVSCDSIHPIASVGAFVDAGSRYESINNSGMSHFLEHFAFKSTANRSDFKLVRDMLAVNFYGSPPFVCVLICATHHPKHPLRNTP
jgi:hypothetical protein